MTRPWLRVIPPQPEKRELRSATIAQGIYMTVYNETVTLASNMSHYGKDDVRILGETLIEISKEMK